MLLGRWVLLKRVTRNLGVTEVPRILGTSVYGAYCFESDWRIKATLCPQDEVRGRRDGVPCRHEFCHHWEWVETGKHGHDKGFDARVRRKPVLWLLCAISRCLPM